MSREGISTDQDTVTVTMETVLMFGQNGVRLVDPWRVIKTANVGLGGVAGAFRHGGEADFRWRGKPEGAGPAGEVRFP